MPVTAAGSSIFSAVTSVIYPKDLRSSHCFFVVTEQCSQTCDSEWKKNTCISPSHPLFQDSPTLEGLGIVAEERLVSHRLESAWRNNVKIHGGVLLGYIRPSDIITR